VGDGERAEQTWFKTGKKEGEGVRGGIGYGGRAAPPFVFQNLFLEGDILFSCVGKPPYSIRIFIPSLEEGSPAHKLPRSQNLSRAGEDWILIKLPEGRGEKKTSILLKYQKSI